jgi:hypothetical protein
MWPDFSNVKDIKFIRGGIFFRHCLDKPIPAWEVTFGNLIIKIISAPFRVFNTLCCGFCSSEILNTLSCFVMILDIVNFIFSIDPSVSVG